MGNEELEKDRERVENRRLLFQDAGEWARHYSNVRMTVSTFAITTSIAILALRWDPNSTSALPPPGVVRSASVLWLLGLLVFGIFTYHTYREFSRQLRKRRYLPDRQNDSSQVKPKYPHYDFATLVIGALTILLAWLLYKQTQNDNAGNIDFILFGLAFLGVIGAFVFSGWLYCYCRAKVQKSSQ